MSNHQGESSSQNGNLEKEVSELRIEVAQLREALRSRTTSGTSTPAPPTQTSSTNAKPAGKLSRSAKRRLKKQRKREEASKMEKNGERQGGNQNNRRSVAMDRGQGPSSSRNDFEYSHESYRDSRRNLEWHGPRDQDHYPTEPTFHGALSTSRSETYYEFGHNANRENWWNDSRYRHESTPPRNNNGYNRGDYQDSRRSEGVRNNYQDRSSQEHGRPYQFRDGYNGNHEYSREESRYCYDPREQDSRRNHPRKEESSPLRNSDRNPYQDSRNGYGSRLSYQEPQNPRNFENEAPQSSGSSSSRWGSQQSHQHNRPPTQYGRRQDTYQEPLDSRYSENSRSFQEPYEGYHQEYQPSNPYRPGSSSQFDSIQTGGRFDGNQAPSRTGSSRRQSPPRPRNDGRYSFESSRPSNRDQPGTSTSGYDNFDSIQIGCRFDGASSRTVRTRRKSPPRQRNDRRFENELGPSRCQIEALRNVPGPSTPSQRPSNSNLQKENSGSWDSLDEIKGTRIERQNPDRQVEHRESQPLRQSPHTEPRRREQRAQNPPPVQINRGFGFGFPPLDFSESSDGPSTSEQRPAPRYYANQEWGQEPSGEPQSLSDSTSPPSDPTSPPRSHSRDIIPSRQRSRQRSSRRPAPVPHGWDVPFPRPGQEQYLVDGEEEQPVEVEEKPEPFTVVFDPFDECMLSSSNGEVKFFEDDKFSWVQTDLDLIKGHGDGDLRARIEPVATPSLVPGKEATYCGWRVKEVIEVIPRPRTPNSDDDLPLLDDAFWRPVEVSRPLPQVQPAVALPETSRPETPRGETTSEEESDGEW
ncbi:hypothetical protein GCK72_010847 [Caenorhabditis remanei]|uniref:Uncharacterized protein n=1 Tax=Caenorhabditis remanei TaxID=31234 RepID=A0A6A5H674_CAERE|nr:hypothetical protein GCK72_010847 [Caenorhabditis remanei]KAF1762585.1 hypothetical protein GCK72_010847 [Caenorhabditis remanei]